MPIWEFCDYLRLHSVNEESITRKKNFLTYWFEGLRMSPHATPFEIEHRLLQITDGLNPKGYNDRLSHLKGFYDFLIATQKFTGSNPCIFVRRKKPVTKVMRCFSQEEVEKIISCPRIPHSPRYEHETYSLLFKLYSYTGIRRSEGINLKIKDLHIDQVSYIILRNTKNGNDVMLPLPNSFAEELMAYVNSYKNVTYVFENRNHQKLYKATVSEVFRKRLKFLGLYDESVGLHSLRRSRISRLLMNHADLIGVQKLANHSSADSTIRYLYVNMNYLQEQAEKDPLFKRKTQESVMNFTKDELNVNV